MKQRDVLKTVEWGVKHFGSVITNRQLPRRDVMREVAAGNVKSIGDVSVCNADGFHLDPERFREGFALTDAGKNVLREIRERDEVRGHEPGASRIRWSAKGAA